MTLGVKSMLLRRTNSIKRSAISGIRDGFRSSRLHTDNDVTYGSNEYIHQSFCTGDNYQAIIKCLNDGYKIAEDLLEYLQEYRDIVKENADKHLSFTTKWLGKMKQQSTISSYNTTKRAQIQTIRLPNKLAQLDQTRCEEMQQVIDTYRQQVERMYPKERLGTVHKHYRADHVKKLFKTAYSSVLKLTETLEKLHEQEKHAKDNLHQADIQCENLSFDPTVSKNKISRAKDTQEQRQDELEVIQDKIARIEKEYTHEQESYQEKAMEIYQECREYEQERLDQIRDTLIRFSQAAHTSDYSNGQNTIFVDLIEHLKTQQNSIQDLDFWASTYHVNVLKKSISSEQNNGANDTVTIESQTITSTTCKTKKSSKNDNEISDTTDNNTRQSVAEDEDDQSTANNNSTSAKSKQNKVKKPVSNDKKTNSTSESTTSNTTKMA